MHVCVCASVCHCRSRSVCLSGLSMSIKRLSLCLPAFLFMCACDLPGRRLLPHSEHTRRHFREALRAIKACGAAMTAYLHLGCAGPFEIDVHPSPLGPTIDLTGCWRNRHEQLHMQCSDASVDVSRDTLVSLLETHDPPSYMTHGRNSV